MLGDGKRGADKGDCQGRVDTTMGRPAALALLTFVVWPLTDACTVSVSAGTVR